MSRARATFAAAAGAAVLAVAVYANSLTNGLVYDDFGVVSANAAAHDPAAWRAILLSPSWFAVPSKEHRPVTTWTFALDYAAHGLEPFGYHLVNVVGHAAVSALVVVLAARVGTPPAAAALAGALFAVHPIHTEAVASVVGRAEILAAGFAVLALLAGRRVARARRPHLAVAATAVAYALALGAKEHAVALVLLVPLADFLLDDETSGARFLRRLPGRRLALYLALVAITAGYVVLRRVALGDVVGAGGFTPPSYWQNPAATAGAWRRVLTALAVETRAVRLLVVPLGLSADYSYRQIPVLASLRDPDALLGVATAGALVALGVAFWRRGKRVPLFWLLFAWLSYLPASNLLFPIGTIFGERLLYLPSLGFCALVAAALARAIQARRKAGRVLAAVVIAAWAGLTAARNPVWHDELSLATATAASSPESTQAHRLLGHALAERGRDEDALREYGRAVEIDPANVFALDDMGQILARRGRTADALPVLERVTRLEPGRFSAWANLAAADNQASRFDEALAAADEALRLRPDFPFALAVRGFALRGLDRRDEARRSFARAVGLAPALPDAYVGLAALAIDAADYAAASQIFERFVAATGSADAYVGLVESYRRAGRPADADRALTAARTRFPADVRFR